MKTNAQMLSKKEQIQKMVSLPAIDLAPEEADRFIDYIVDQSVLKNNARVERMAKETKSIRALGLGAGAFLHPGGTFSASDYLKQLTTQKINLVSKKVRGCIAIFDDDLEDNVEGDAFVDHLMKMVAAKIANELSQAFWIGDRVNLSGFGLPEVTTDIRGLFDGWRYRLRNSQVVADAFYNVVTGRCTLMTGRIETDWAVTTAALVGGIVKPTATYVNGYAYICTVAGTSGGTEPTWPAALGETVVDGTVTWRCHEHVPVLGGKIAVHATSAPYDWEFKYDKMLSIFPSMYKVEGLSNMRFFNSDQVLQNYISALAARATILGDQAILGQGPLQYGQVPIVPAPLMPTTMTAAGVLGGGTYADVLLTLKYNLIVGIQRDIRIESQRSAADEATYWFYSMRADTAVENVNAAVLLEKLVVL